MYLAMDRKSTSLDFSNARQDFAYPGYLFQPDNTTLHVSLDINADVHPGEPMQLQRLLLLDADSGLVLAQVQNTPYQIFYAALDSVAAAILVPVVDPLTLGDPTGAATVAVETMPMQELEVGARYGGLIPGVTQDRILFRLATFNRSLQVVIAPTAARWGFDLCDPVAGGDPLSYQYNYDNTPSGDVGICSSNLLTPCANSAYSLVIYGVIECISSSQAGCVVPPFMVLARDSVPDASSDSLKLSTFVCRSVCVWEGAYLHRCRLLGRAATACILTKNTPCRVGLDAKDVQPNRFALHRGADGLSTLIMTTASVPFTRDVELHAPAFVRRLRWCGCCCWSWVVGRQGRAQIELSACRLKGLH